MAGRKFDLGRKKGIKSQCKVKLKANIAVAQVQSEKLPETIDAIADRSDMDTGLACGRLRPAAISDQRLQSWEKLGGVFLVIRPNWTENVADIVPGDAVVDNVGEQAKARAPFSAKPKHNPGACCRKHFGRSPAACH